MKKSMSWIVGLSVLAALGGGVAQAQKHHKGRTPMCPMMIEGAVVQVANVENGVTIHITAQDPATVKKIQTAAAEMAKHHVMAGSADEQKQEIYVCPMGDYRGSKTKDGHCPKCGMELRKE